MQDCFRQYPEIYGAELADEAEAEAAQESPDAPAAQTSNETPAVEYQKLRDEPPAASIGASENKPEAYNLPGAVPANDAVPAKWEDATAANKEVEVKKDDAKARSDA